MESGKLRHLFIIEENTPTVDSFGSRIDSWAKFVSVHGSIAPLSGREFFAAQQYEAEVKAKARIRFIPGIEETMRLLHDGLYYNIIFVQDRDMRHRELTLFLSGGLRD